MENAKKDQRRIIPPGANRREIVLAVVGALVAIGLVGYAVMNIGGQSSAVAITGKVIAKKFVPRPETQLTIGAGGVQRTDKTGQYFIEVKARDSGAVFHILLSEDDYNRAQIGDDYQIPKAALVP